MCLIFAFDGVISMSAGVDALHADDVTFGGGCNSDSDSVDSSFMDNDLCLDDKGVKDFDLKSVKGFASWIGIDACFKVLCCGPGTNDGNDWVIDELCFDTDTECDLCVDDND